MGPVITGEIQVQILAEERYSTSRLNGHRLIGLFALTAHVSDSQIDFYSQNGLDKRPFRLIGQKVVSKTCGRLSVSFF